MAKPAKIVKKTKLTGVQQRAKAKGQIHIRRKSKVRPGIQLGHLHVIKRVATKQGESGGQKWDCECSCGTRLTIPQWYLVRNEFPKRHCGCRQKEPQPYTRERGIFYMMHRRCYNPTHVAYKHYGGATPPVQVCDPWNKDKVGNEVAFQNFLKDMGPAPSKKHTLDRIDPYNGYGWHPDLVTGEVKLNCRWATATEQMNNLKRHWQTPEERKKAIEMESFSEEIGDDMDDEEDDGGDTEDGEG